MPNTYNAQMQHELPHAELRQSALIALAATEPADKMAQVRTALHRWQHGQLTVDTQVQLDNDLIIPGRPD